MTTIRVKHESRFTTIANEVIQDQTLSLAARGLHHLLLSYPHDWIVKVDHLANHCLESKKTILKLMKELEDKDYLVRSTKRAKSGKFEGVNYDIYELPQTQIRHTVETPSIQGSEISQKAKSGSTSKFNPCSHFGDAVESRPTQGSRKIEKAESIDIREVEPQTQNGHTASIYNKKISNKELVCDKTRAQENSPFGFVLEVEDEPEVNPDPEIGEEIKFSSQTERSEFYDFMVSKLSDNGRPKNVSQNIANSCCIQIEKGKMTESTRRDFIAFKTQKSGQSPKINEATSWRDSLIAEVFSSDFFKNQRS